MFDTARENEKGRCGCTGPDLRFIQDGIHVKVVSERLGHANIAFTMQTYQHLLPGMQEDAAASTERLAKPVPPTESASGERRGKPRRKSA